MKTWYNCQFIKGELQTERVFVSFWMTSDENFKIIQKIETENAKKEEIQKEKESIKKEAVAKPRKVKAAIKRKQFLKCD